MHRHFFLWFMLISPVLYAQENNLLHFERIEGLSQNTVYSITKDRDGFMWIGTADGLNRYDGVEMKIYKPSAIDETGKLKGRFIRTGFMEDDNGELLFSSELTLFELNKKKGYFHDYYFRDSASGKSLGLSAEPLLQKDNQFWFANGSFGVVEYNRLNKHHTVYALPTDNNGNQIFIQAAGAYDGKERIWFAGSNGLYSFHIRNHQWRYELAVPNSYRTAFSADTVFISSGNGIIYFDIKNNRSAKAELKNENTNSVTANISALYADKNNNIWAGDISGNVFCKQKQSSNFQCRGNINEDNPGSIQYPVYCFFADENRTLWVGSDVLGLLRTRMNYSGFNSFPAASNKKDKRDFFINAIYEDENDKVWLGVYTKGVMLFDKKNRHATQLSFPDIKIKNEFEKTVSFIKEDSAGNLWIGYAGYLIVREKEKKDFKLLKIPTPQESLNSVNAATCFMQGNNKWLLGTTKGLYVLEKKEGSYLFTHNKEISQPKISDLWIKNEHETWIGFDGGGIGQLISNQPYDGSAIQFAKMGIKSFYYDELHHINWISTLSGLIALHIPTNQYKIFTEADGLGNSYVYGSLMNENELWISTNKGLSKATVTWKKNEVLPRLSFVNYSSSDGLPDNEFNTGAFHKGPSGNFYFGTTKGLSWFKPGEVNPNHNKPIIRLLDIKVNEEKADSSVAAEFITELSLPYIKNNLYFRFRGIEYLNPANVSYAYKMENLDKDWYYSGTLNEVRYNALPPGHYIFRIKAANGSGVWSEKEVQVKINIQAPFWKRWWFYSLTGLILIGVIVIVTRYISQNRLKEKIRLLEKQQAVEAERNRISKDMHDEIGSGLTRIALMTELMHTQKQLDEKTKQDVNEIADSTRQLVESMSEIIWTLNPHNDKLEDLLAYLREQTQHYFEPLDVEYKILFPDLVPDVKLSNEQRRNLFLVTKEALNNSLKHSGASRIELSSDTAGGKLKFTVTDNGKGINDTKKRAGANGLRNMQQRMKDINGGIEWNSQNGNGTQVNYWIHF